MVRNLIMADCRMKTEIISVFVVCVKCTWATVDISNKIRDHSVHLSQKGPESQNLFILDGNERKIVASWVYDENTWSTFDFRDAYLMLQSFGVLVSNLWGGFVKNTCS